MKNLYLLTQSLTIFTSLKNEKVYSLIQNVLNSYDKGISCFLEHYSNLCQYSFENGTICDTLYKALIETENAFAKNIDGKTFEQLNETLMSAAQSDIQTLRQIATISSRQLLNYASDKFLDDIIYRLPIFENGDSFPVENAEELFAVYKKNGYGFFSQGSAFYIKNSEIKAVKNKDDVNIGNLKEYEREKYIIINNTRDFLEGKLCNNILLYGDKGTGKSSTIKAIANYFADENLKIIEVRQDQICDYLDICEVLADNPYKFILFLDDLNFADGDQSFNQLKAFIEGSIIKKPDNVVIYATTNRRHLVKENFSDRMGDEIHTNDTIESITALHNRFGIEITFQTPSRREYLLIVDQLAQDFGIHHPELYVLAEKYALKRGGRSPRVATQFIATMQQQ